MKAQHVISSSGYKNRSSSHAQYMDIINRDISLALNEVKINKFDTLRIYSEHEQHTDK